MDNKQLMEILNDAFNKNKREGIVMEESPRLSIALTIGIGNQDFKNYLEVIRPAHTTYKIIPKEGVLISFIGQDVSTEGLYKMNYYAVVTESISFAVKVDYCNGDCEGARTILMEKVPNYLLVKFREKILSNAAN